MGDYRNTACFIARCQPFHTGHKYIVDTLLTEGKKVIIALYDTEPDDRNPFSPYERTKMINDIYGNRVETIIIPAFGILVKGRATGYTIREFPEYGDVSATKIREAHRIIWLTGQSGAGKTTLANNLRLRLRSIVLDSDVIVLDGDGMRRSISIEIDYSLEGRLESAKRTARLALELSQQQNVVVASIAATKHIREAINTIAHPIWVYVKRSFVPEWEDAPYEPPEDADVVVDNDELNIREASDFAWEKIVGILCYPKNS